MWENIGAFVGLILCPILMLALIVGVIVTVIN